MFEIYPSNWPATFDANDPRDRFHRTALADAMVTTEYRPQLALEAQSRPGIVERMRPGFAGGTHSPIEPCSCPA